MQSALDMLKVVLKLALVCAFVYVSGWAISGLNALTQLKAEHLEQEAEIDTLTRERDQMLAEIEREQMLTATGSRQVLAARTE